MKILGISDLHGHLPDYSYKYADICCIAGDIVPLQIQRNVPESKKWFEETFKPWAESLNVDKVIFIGGNHDFYLFNNEEQVRQLFPKYEKVTFLSHEEYDYLNNDGNVYKIFGTPWCHLFGNWSFMASDEELEKKYKDIPNNCDILITHDCPYGYNDVLCQNVPWNNRQHIGNKPLTKIIEEKQPKVVLNAHLHSTDHDETNIGKSKCYNCSILNERYNIAYLPQMIDI